MTLAIEVVGVLVVAGVLRMLASNVPSLPAAIAALAMVFGGAAFWFNGYGTLRTLLHEHDSNDGLSRQQANAAAGGLFPADEGFLAWADVHLPRMARVFMACSGHCPGEWVTFRLAPRVFVSNPSEAEYALFYDIPPASAPYARGKPLAVFAPRDTSGDAEFVAGQEAIAKLSP